MPPAVVRFGAFELDRQSGELTRSGRSVHLTPQAATLLSLLTGRAGELVTREEIRSALWTDQTFVDYEAAIHFSFFFFFFFFFCFFCVFRSVTYAIVRRSSAAVKQPAGVEEVPLSGSLKR